jgi:hypothetical protein
LFAPSDYAFDQQPERIAQEATELRAASRLLHVAPGGAIAAHDVAELICDDGDFYGLRTGDKLNLHPSPLDVPGEAP